MVLVSYILYENISILQTKFSNREGHEARRGGLEVMPLDQHVKCRHGEREGHVPAGCGECFETSPVPAERRQSAGHQHSKRVFHPSLNPLALHLTHFPPEIGRSFSRYL